MELRRRREAGRAATQDPRRHDREETAARRGSGRHASRNAVRDAGALARTTPTPALPLMGRGSLKKLSSPSGKGWDGGGWNGRDFAYTPTSASFPDPDTMKWHRFPKSPVFPAGFKWPFQ